MCSSRPTSVASAGSSSTDRSRRCAAALPWYGNTASAADEAEADRVGTAARIDHRVAEQRGTRARRGEHRAAVVRLDDRGVERAPLQHRAQVQRRTVGDVDEAWRRGRASRCRPVRRRGGSRPRARRPSRRARRTTRSPARRRASGARTRPRPGSTSTSSPPDIASSAPSRSRYGSCHSPPPSRASVPVGFFAAATAADPTAAGPARGARWPRLATRR